MACLVGGVMVWQLCRVVVRHILVVSVSSGLLLYGSCGQLRIGLFGSDPLGFGKVR